MKTCRQFPFLIFLWFLLVSCKSESQAVDLERKTADVVAVNTSGEESHYQFSVTLSCPDTGCDQYADWWEVVSASGELLYRRILAHSHLDEQPFTRSGGEVQVLRNQKVWVRAHMNNTGYGGKTFFGTVGSGFDEQTIPEDFALGLESESPLPSGCSF